MSEGQVEKQTPHPIIMKKETPIKIYFEGVSYPVSLEAVERSLKKKGYELKRIIPPTSSNKATTGKTGA